MISKNELLYDKNQRQIKVGQCVRYSAWQEFYPCQGTGEVISVTPEIYGSFTIKPDAPTRKQGPGGFLHQAESLWWQCSYDYVLRKYIAYVGARDTGDLIYPARYVEIIEEKGSNEAKSDAQ